MLLLPFRLGDNVESNLCAVSYWTEMSVALRSLPDLKEIVREKVASEMLARSLLIYSVESVVYLLVALGDGTLHYFQIDQKTGIFLLLLFSVILERDTVNFYVNASLESTLFSVFLVFMWSYCGNS